MWKTLWKSCGKVGEMWKTWVLAVENSFWAVENSVETG